jgi:hypothetical protein
MIDLNTGEKVACHLEKEFPQVIKNFVFILTLNV